MTPAEGPVPAEQLAWLAQGVRQHILLRVLPVQRHDALGPLSVARMALALVQRRLSNPQPALQALADKVAEVDTQVADAVKALARLRWWDSAHQPPRPWAEVVHDCTHLLQLAASLRGHTLNTGHLWPANGSQPWVPTPSAHLSVLGLLMHAMDRHADEPHAFSLQALPADAADPAARAGLRLDKRGLAHERAHLGGATTPADTPASGLSWQAYQWLMADTGFEAQADAQGWTLTAPATLSSAAGSAA